MCIKAPNSPIGTRDFRLAVKLCVFSFGAFLALYSAIGMRIIAREPFIAAAQNIGEEFCTPILSMFEVMLQISATPSISLGPFSLNSALNGERIPLFISLALRA